MRSCWRIICRRGAELPIRLILQQDVNQRRADVGSYKEFSCSVLSSEGRVFPVEIEYAAEPGYVDKRPVWEQAAEAFSHYVGSGGEGDVLVFMPGGYEISQTIEAIRHTSEVKRFYFASVARRTFAQGPGRRGGALRPAQGGRFHQRRRDLADH